MSNTQASVEGSVSPSLTDSGNSNAAGASSQSNTTRVAAKRKTITPRSEVWSHFTKFVSSEGQSKGKCNYCDREFCCDGKKNGTGSLKYHMKQWEVGQISTWKFDQEATRNALAQMIVIGEMPFKFVENEGFRKFMSVACPRWNSTYLMLDTAQNFERAFERFEEQDTKFKAELELGEGWPTTNDWSSVRNLRDFLEHFYEVTLRVSGTSYVTSNNFFDELTEIDILLQDAQSNVDIDFSVMAMKMKDKYDKYWGDIDKMNMLIFVACVLDPRQKLNYLEFALSEMYNSGKSSEWGGTVFVNDPQQKVKRRMKDLFKRRVIENGGEDQTSELDKYLGEATENQDDGFDILLWWKVNSPRFPALSKMAKDVLAIPLSTVASESAFSTGGCVLDQFRSSLTPKMVQALVCTQDYIRNPSTEEEIKKIEEQIQELDKIDNDSSWNALDPTLNS
ncbi:hypothetical protein GQ457_04G027140 [Hibiscus cannabinus]